ncbi:prenyltransferases like protein [Babesia gibsoni]|uniref:Prenyltransferases like protein n=1 Tax=Babesia gibsoni TaxID=33632 RepID=A0AAD8USS2_BABGI|nr:prenyltransferases like protein [Babesia gibsoni]
MWSAVAALPPVFGLEEAKKMGLFFLGSFFARTAGCCVNDIADRNIDKHVERTKTRPLAAGLISKREALGILTVNASLGFLVLMQFDLNTIRFGLFTALGACIYPFMKRFINYPQLVLGLASNIGVFIGWSAMMQPFTLTPLLIYLASSLWTVIYDTVYAHQDKRFDKHIGVKSLALHWGDRTKRNCNIAALGMSALLAAAGYNAELNKCFYGALALSHIWMTRQIKLVDLEDSTSCLTFFKRSILYGALVLGGIATGKDVSFQMDK